MDCSTDFTEQQARRAADLARLTAMANNPKEQLPLRRSDLAVDEIEAPNEKLAAAAPEMLALITDLVRLLPLEPHELDAYIGATFAPAARAIIAKVKN